MKKNPEITDATRNRLIRAFCTLYQNKPIQKITVKEITDLAGYHRSTFYQYFTDVFALLQSIEDEMIETGLQELQSIQIDDPDFNRQFVMRLAEVLQEHQDSYAIVLLRADVHSEFFQKIKAKAVPIMMEYFHISPNNIKAAFIFEFYMTGIWTMLTHWLENPEQISVEELSTLIHGIWYEGLLAQL